ncbi:para-nitrobenzyl esterase isoform X1 [Periophthalmus magnuspinnatus]|uniref:para-nitrobenzyl esterase isoform X1 n=2 Tax=Periophthalmus magnuspinnatus TaxID=409849 RepID=UPI002436D171|nr:para-nitrobenzyl esterase isoform X1 [Periophthalmus magnuspinnatus]
MSRRQRYRLKMSEEVFEVSGRNEYRYLVQDEDEEVQYARHRQYISPLVVLSRRCIALIVMGVVALLILATYLGYVAKTLPPGAAYVSTPCGSYNGQHKNGAYSFKGLRYAAPPVGPLRWAPPVAAECNSDAVHDATRFGSVCAQIHPLSSSGLVLGHEDCLSLNVWTPSLTPPTHLPVVVWVHGGYLQMLSGGEAGYSPSERLAAETGVVYVSFNYRLNAFGFMALEMLREGSPTNTSGNYGFMDQILALQWVQKNIHLFGGDASKVTIMGQSSGGTSVWTLMMSPLAKGLFSAAVDISGSYVYKATLQEAEKDNLVFLNKTGCKDASCLRRLSVQQVLQAVPWQEYPFWAYDDGTDLPTRGLLPGAVAVVDGHVLPDAPLSMWASGRQDYSDVPFVIGTTEQEVDFYPPFQNISDWTWGDYSWFVTEKLSTFNESLAKLALEQYPSSAPCPTTERCPERAYTTMASDIRGNCPNHELARRAAAALHSPVYRYMVTHTPSRAISPSPPLLSFPSRFSFHTLDTVAFFRGLEPLLGSPLSQNDQRFQDLITHHLIYFFKQGKMEASWPEFPSSVALLSQTLTVVQTNSSVVSRCRLWEESGMLEYAWVN